MSLLLKTPMANDVGSSLKIIFYGTLNYGRGNMPGVMTGVLNTHPLALEHLMPVLMSFYVG
jgi:ubiquitin conjugation factor E4 B